MPPCHEAKFGNSLPSLAPIVNASAAIVPAPWQPEPSGRLQHAVDSTVESAAARFPTLRKEDLAITLVDVADPDRPLWGRFRGDRQIYPASVIKLFYLVAIHQWMEDGKIADGEEIRRGMRDMIVDSGNEATQYLVDVLTGTTSGPDLGETEMEAWFHRRNGVNRYFASLGYAKVNANRKPWTVGPYGREMQSVKMHEPLHRNWLTTDETARLFSEIAAGKAVSPVRSKEMMGLLERDRNGKDPEASDFFAAGLPEDAKVWAKAGWTSQTRHSAAYIKLPAGGEFVLVVFTEHQSENRDLLPTIARQISGTLGSRPTARIDGR